jgi:hypothetical protein
MGTVGDHFLRLPPDAELIRRQVAEELGAEVCSLRNWQANRTKPALKFMPAITRFLG